MNSEVLKTAFQPWPLAILLLLLVFYRDIKRILGEMKIARIEISAAGIAMNLSADDIKSTTGPLLQVMADTLKPDEKIYFSRIVAGKRRALTVCDLFKKPLERDKITKNPIGEPSISMLTTLRALRGFGLIQPKRNKNAPWESDSEIEVTDFGHFVSTHPELKKLLEVPVIPRLVTKIDSFQEKPPSEPFQPTS